MSQTNFLVLAERLITERFPERLCAFVGGSHVTGRENEGSDIDLWLILPENHADPQRMSFIYENMPIELFLHTAETIASFLHHDQQLGSPPNCHAICHSLMWGPDLALAEKIRRTAAHIIAAGPQMMSQESLEDRRYQITGTLKSLENKKTKNARPIVADLYLRLADFHLRANRQWSGRSKYIMHDLKNYDPELAVRYEKVFDDAFRGKYEKLISLIDDILAPHGGRLFDGYQRYVIKIPKSDNQAAA